MNYGPGTSTVILRNLLADPTDNTAFDAFVHRFQPRIKDACRRRLQMQDADADDLTATILLQFYERETFRTFVYRSKPAFYSWLNRVIKNAFLTFIRERKRAPDTWSLANHDAQKSLEEVCMGIADDIGAVCEEDIAFGQLALEHVKERVDAQTFEAFTAQIEGEKGTEVAKRLGIRATAAWKARSRVASTLLEEYARLSTQDLGDR